jgi:hypothetical protein
MVKKKELKKRAIYVYPPAKMSERWKAQANKSNTSISKFVIEHVENSLNMEQEEGYSSRSVIIEENRQLRETLTEKERRISHLELLVEKLGEDLRMYRARIFTDEDFRGVRNYDKKLIALLKEPGVRTSEEILDRLGIGAKESEAVKAVSKQLENLEAYGLVRSTGKGWMWKE